MKLNTLAVGSILGVIAVILGALGAHALKTVLSVEQLESFETAVRFQMYHAILIILVGFINQRRKSELLQLSSWFFLAGVILFSGSIYILSTKDIIGLNDARLLGPVTPVGGILLITGWSIMVIDAFKKRETENATN